MITKISPDLMWQYHIKAKMICDKIEKNCSDKYSHIIGCHHYFNRVIDFMDDGNIYFKIVRKEWNSRQNIYKEKTLEKIR